MIRIDENTDVRIGPDFLIDDEISAAWARHIEREQFLLEASELDLEGELRDQEDMDAMRERQARVAAMNNRFITPEDIVSNRSEGPGALAAAVAIITLAFTIAFVAWMISPVVELWWLKLGSQ